MSEISVNRTAGGGRCLIIDGTRVAGGKPEFSGNNCVCWWQTNETIGVVDELEAENAKLRELAKSAWGCVNRHVSCDACRMTFGGCTLQSAMHELGIEVEE